MSDLSKLKESDNLSKFDLIQVSRRFGNKYIDSSVKLSTLYSELNVVKSVDLDDFELIKGHLKLKSSNNSSNEDLDSSVGTSQVLSLISELTNRISQLESQLSELSKPSGGLDMMYPVPDVTCEMHFSKRVPTIHEFPFPYIYIGHRCFEINDSGEECYPTQLSAIYNEKNEVVGYQYFIPSNTKLKVSTFGNKITIYPFLGYFSNHIKLDKNNIDARFDSAVNFDDELNTVVSNYDALIFVKVYTAKSTVTNHIYFLSKNKSVTLPKIKEFPVEVETLYVFVEK